METPAKLPPETLPAQIALRRVQRCRAYFNWSRFEAFWFEIIRLKPFRQQSFIQEVKGYCVDSNRFFIASLQQYANSAASLMPPALHLYAVARLAGRKFTAGRREICLHPPRFWLLFCF
jgi:hypothetical protein